MASSLDNSISSWKTRVYVAWTVINDLIKGQYYSVLQNHTQLNNQFQSHCKVRTPKCEQVKQYTHINCKMYLRPFSCKA